jgi:hypothetical protein
MNKKGKRGNFSPISPKNQEWTGEIIAKKRKKVYTNNEFRDKIYYRLKVTKDNNQKPETVFVYSNLVSKEIFADIELINYEGKRYLFFGERIKWGWILHNWQELPATSTFSENKEPKFKAYE